MPAGVGVLRAERRPEGVDLGEREAVRLHIELARHRQERLAAEEILGEVDLALRRARQVGEVERRHAEQLPRPFGVGRRDDRRVDPDEAALVEEPVDRLRQRVAHARRRPDHVGARPQVRDLAQELHRVRLRLDRIGVGIVDPADHLDRAGLHLERLPLRRRRHDRSRRLDGAAGGQLQDLVGVVGQRVGRDHLHRMERRSVGQMHERNAGLRIAPGAHPAFDGDGCVRRRRAGEDRADVEFRIAHGVKSGAGSATLSRVPADLTCADRASLHRPRVVPRQNVSCRQCAARYSLQHCNRTVQLYYPVEVGSVGARDALPGCGVMRCCVPGVGLRDRKKRP